jgi:hypothetical protein
MKHTDLKYGIYDIINDRWVLDCFDEPNLFETAEQAEEFRTTTFNHKWELSMNNPNFQVRLKD